MRLLRYFSYRLGIGACPNFLEIYPELIVFFDRIMKWPTRLRVKDAANCPSAGPAVFAGNHFATDDPFIMYRAIHRVCEGAYPVRYMMRDDFFKTGGGILKSRLLDVDELARLVGSLQISRDRVQLSQLKPFIALLREQGAFILYPGRSRSRTGAFIEYREGVEEPGGITFLVAQAQRNRPELRVAIVPMARTQNLATRKSVVVFGAPVFLPHDADRAAQRELDFRLIELMGDLVEINVTHIIAGIIYLHCLHGRTEPLCADALDQSVEYVLSQLPKRHIDPAALSDRGSAIGAALAFFERGGQGGSFIRLTGTGIRCNTEAVLASPPHDTAYRTANPVKYSLNQIIHLPDVVNAIELAATLASTRNGHPPK